MSASIPPPREQQGLQSRKRALFRGGRGRVCPWWALWTFDNPLRRLVHDPDGLLGRWVHQGMTVSDVGCGAGYFTVGMARLVGPHGRVLAADVQPRMLEMTFRRALNAGLSDRVTTVLVRPQEFLLPEAAHFILAFWMLHEVPDQERFLTELASSLAPDGLLLVAEPVFHVSEANFSESMAAARSVGWTVVERPRIRFSRAALMKRGLR